MASRPTRNGRALRVCRASIMLPALARARRVPVDGAPRCGRPDGHHEAGSKGEGQGSAGACGDKGEASVPHPETFETSRGERVARRRGPAPVDPSVAATRAPPNSTTTVSGSYRDAARPPGSRAQAAAWGCTSRSPPAAPGCAAHAEREPLARECLGGQTAPAQLLRSLRSDPSLHHAMGCGRWRLRRPHASGTITLIGCRDNPTLAYNWDSSHSTRP